ncbi:LamG-like jellyroll fold domain-containing protein [Candidatus Latescibacterota bacterium]
MPLLAGLRDHICLYASFDTSMDADVSRGDGQATWNGDVARRDPASGRHGGDLAFAAADHGWAEDEFTYAAAGNFPYDSGGFSGTISLWLSCDPDVDLCDDVPVDPFHISRHPSDASFYLDLTRPNDDRYGSPRKLRFGFYNDSPEQSRFVGGHLIVVGELGWRRGEWHHVVATWENANSGREDGSAAVYIDGVRRGWMAGYSHQLTWDMDELTIGLGQRYAGGIDELLILDRALAGSEVEELHGLAEPLGECL